MDTYDDSAAVNRKRKLSDDCEASNADVAPKKHVALEGTVDEAAIIVDANAGDSVEPGAPSEAATPHGEAGESVAALSEGVIDQEAPSVSAEGPDASVYNGGPSLLDLPDESLLHILAFCKPREIKALGFVCVRLSDVCRSRRALWTHVDLTDAPCGRRRLATYIRGQYLHKGTLSLAVKGYSDSTRGCQGRSREKPETEGSASGASSNMGTNQFISYNDQGFAIMDMSTLPDYVQMNRYGSEFRRPAESPSKSPPKLPRLRGSPVVRDAGAGCTGPRWTLHGCLLTSLTKLCPQLTELRIEYCNLDCDLVRITDFPPSLRKLSLKGTRCYDTPLSQTYLFKIHSTLEGLESIDVSHCTWLSASYLLSLSKMPNLKELIARRCYRLGECVAYSSLATRYGFKALEVLDIRETPMGDSEVASLGFLPRLRELYLQAPLAPATADPDERVAASAYYDTPKHTHKPDEVLEDESDIEDWELPDLMTEETSDEWLSKKPNKQDKSDHDPSRCKFNLMNCSLHAVPRRSCQGGANDYRNIVIAAATSQLARNRAATISIDIQSLAAACANRMNNAEAFPEGARPGPSGARGEAGDNPARPARQDNNAEEAAAADRRQWQIGGRMRRAALAAAEFDRPGRSIEFVSEQAPFVRNFRDNFTLELSQAGPVWQPGAAPDDAPPARPEPEENSNQNQEGAPERDAAQDRERAQERHRFPFANVHVVACMGADSFPIHRQDITDPQQLVSDYALLRLGRSQNTDVFHIGPDGVVVISANGGNIPGSRPDKSTLEKLVCVGYSRVTDRAMHHLAVSAPRLTHIDVRNTSVTEAGVAAVPHATVII